MAQIMRTVLDIFVEIFRNLWAHKLRSFLTMFGIAWGVGSLLLLVGVGEGFRSGNKREMAEFGKDIMFIFPGRAPAVRGSMNSARSYLLTYQDYVDVRTQAAHVRNACPLLSRTDLHEVSEFSNGGGEILGVEPQLSEISYLPLKDGRWLNEMDGSQRRNVIVLGQRTAEDLVPRASRRRFVHPGERHPFRSRGHPAAPRPGRQQLAEYARLHPFPGHGHILSRSREKTTRTPFPILNISRRVRAEHVLAQNDVHKIVARNHGFDASDENAFDGWDTIKQSQMVGTIFDVMNMFLGAVGMVTLALGAIGVINIMLVAVSERTHEIGLRKALGATNRNILFHFFLEGLLLTLGSGLIGMGLAAGLMAMMGTVHGPGGFDPPKLVPMSAMLAIGSLTLAGVVAGLYPARKAAMLQPVEALRQE